MNSQKNEIDVGGRYSEEFISLIGFDAFVKLCKEYGGTSIYIPKYETMSRGFKQKLVLEEFDKGILGIKEITLKYGISERTMYRYINERKNKKIKREG